MRKFFSILFVLMGLGILTAEETTVFIGLKKDVPIEKNPTNISVVNEIDIIETNAKTVGEAIENTTGITEVSKRGTLGSSSNLRIRSGGDSSKQVLVMVDGRPANDTSLGSADLTQIPTENIERIEVMRGPASALYGSNASGGVVNIITKKAIHEKPRTEIGLSFGNFRTQNYNMNFSAKPGKAHIFLSGSKNLTDGFRENSQYDSLGLSLKTGYDFEKYGEFTLTNGFLNSELGAPGTNATLIEEFDDDKERAASATNANQEDKKYYNQLEHSIKIQRTTLKTKLYWDYHKRHYKNPDAAATDTIAKPQNLGFDTQFETVYDVIFGFEKRFEKYTRLDSGIETTDKKRENFAAFVQKTFGFDKLSLTPGIRYDYNSTYKESTNPRVSAVYQLADKVKLSANIGTAFCSPTFEDLYSPYTSWPASAWGNAGDTKGNTNIKPEKSVGTDFGVEFNATKNLLFKATLFYSNVRDLIEWKNVSTSSTYDEWRPSNVGKAFSRGIEFETGINILENLSQKTNYTFLESKGKAEGETYKTLQYTPKHRFNYSLNYLAPAGVKTKLSAEYTHKQEWMTSQRYEIPGYTTVGFRVGKEILQAEVFASLENMFDKRYVSRENYPLPGRTFSTGIKVHF